jgi:hypothetical protein
VVERRKACAPCKARAAPQGAEVTELRLSAFRFPLFRSFFCSPDGAKRNPGAAKKPDYRSRITLTLHPGYVQSVIVMAAGTTAGFV